jgi:FkbM family methyltransferase
VHLDRPERVPSTDIERARYLTFSRTWASSARLSPLSAEVIEQRLIRYFRRLCRRIEPAVVLEVGAHEAAFSRWAVEHLPSARVMAFEANPHVHAKYAEVVTAAGVDYRNLAVGPVNGEVELNLPLEVRGRARKLTSRMASLAVHTRASDQVQVTVPSVRLDDHVTLPDRDRVVAWIDVEGANDAVLQSGPAVLERTDALYIEVESETTWEGQWLDSDVALHLQQHGLIPVARDVKRRHQYNVVYVRAGLAQGAAITRQAAGVLHRPPRDT